MKLSLESNNVDFYSVIDTNASGSEIICFVGFLDKMKIDNLVVI